MGIDFHAFNFLIRASQLRPLGKTVTIGRQTIHLDDSWLQQRLGTPFFRKNQYCDELLIKCFGSSTVDSIDNSDYEQATIVHDMNLPLSTQLANQYDTVIDCGCLEHIYNTPQALRNCSHLLRPGGQIIHVLPANNFCGHGFWQFSPELFFSLYTSANGYQDTEVFLADLSNTARWYQVKVPSNGQRVNVESSTGLYVLVRTTLKGPEFAQDNIQQSDYVYEWSRPVSQVNPTPHGTFAEFRRMLKRVPFLYGLLSPCYHYYLHLISRTKLSKRNPGVVQISIATLLDAQSSRDT